MMATEGMFVYLNSGEMQAFPAATSFRLDAEMLLVFEQGELIVSIARNSVWLASQHEEQPTLG